MREHKTMLRRMYLMDSLLSDEMCEIFLRGWLTPRSRRVLYLVRR